MWQTRSARLFVGPALVAVGTIMGISDLMHGDWIIGVLLGFTAASGVDMTLKGLRMPRQ